MSQVCDLLHHNGEFLSFENFKSRYDIKCSFLEFYGVISAVKTYKKSLRLEDCSSKGLIDSTPVMQKTESLKKGSKAYYYILTHSSTIPISQYKWQLNFTSELNLSIIYRKHFKTTQETKLCWFQFRLVHRILTTNVYFSKLHIIDSANCNFCDNCGETLLHLFWDCNIVRLFWDDLVKWISEKCDHVCDLKLSPELVIFGGDNLTKFDCVFDLILLLAKFYIYKCRCAKREPNITAFKNELGLRYSIEKKIHFCNKTLDKFQSKWRQYHTLFE